MELINHTLLAASLVCAIWSARCAFRKKWEHAVLFAIPVALFVILAAFSMLKGRVIRQARQEAIQRGDIKDDSFESK